MKVSSATEVVPSGCERQDNRELCARSSNSWDAFVGTAGGKVWPERASWSRGNPLFGAGLSADYSAGTLPIVLMHDKASQAYFNAMLQSEYWRDIREQDVRGAGKSYQTFSCRNAGNSVSSRVSGVIAAPLDVVTEVVFNHQDGLDGKSRVSIMQKLTPTPIYDPEIGASFNEYYQALDATLFAVGFVDRVYSKVVDQDTVMIWFEKSPREESWRGKVAEIQARRGYDPITYFNPRNISGGYILKRDPAAPERTHLTFMSRSEFDNQAVQLLTKIEYFIKMGALGSFADFNALAQARHALPRR